MRLVGASEAPQFFAQKHEVREIVIDAIANAAGGENVAGGEMLHAALWSRVQYKDASLPTRRICYL